MNENAGCVRTLGIERSFAGLILRHLVHGVLFALLAFAKGALGLRHVHLHISFNRDE